ncbi:hypothetical protein [Brucella pseudogrignonensis]|uniref:hypothetical protein n=1 Tax=Brucella pseudogrignonensis TaxID=419475 RepID=UPI000CFD6EC2|nr:hypothetical protein [Brucella pseudogrignonensis]MQP40931.1 hypothetical protein [Ochrobactrum sp. MYb237]PQZ40885.1 hypothetical protein CQ059_16670 [Brucella pseudogrignonensis]PRA40396.1 hypothetical protein CQ063_12485 [Brucella pseudogrignonensis]PRA68989.1 hypothetical protein CQ055_12370 [Brucella pseudogrignonensis]
MDQHTTTILSYSQLLAALVTAVATIALWYVTRVLAVETKTLAKMTSQPFVVCSLQSSQADASALDLILENTGNAVAFDVDVTITPALPDPHGNKVERETNSKINISMLPPSLTYRKQGVMWRDVYDQNYQVKIDWKTHPEKSNVETLSYSFSPKEGFRGGWNVKGLHQIANELEKVNKSLSKR